MTYIYKELHVSWRGELKIRSWEFKGYLCLTKQLQNMFKLWFE